MSIMSNITWQKIESEEQKYYLDQYYKSKTYYAMGTASLQLSVKATYANSFRAYPIIFSKKTHIDRFAIYVNTVYLTGAYDFKIGVYDNAENRIYPSELILDAGLVNVSTTGKKSFKVSLELDPGLYWFCYLTNNYPDCYAIPASAFPNILGYDSDLITDGYNAYYKNYSYAEALPNSYPDGASLTRDNCVIFYRMV